MDAAVKRIAPQTQCYQRRRPEKTLWYRTVQTHFETWLAHSTWQGDESTPAYIEQAFRRYLDCGILANGFARAHCDECGHDFLIAFSCKGRGVCPSCNTRRMAETAAHLSDHVFPRLPVRQWVLSVPKRLRYFLQRDTALQGAVLRIAIVCSPWVGLCAAFCVCRFLALTRPIFAMGTGEVLNLSWFWGGNRIDGGIHYAQTEVLFDSCG